MQYTICEEINITFFQGVNTSYLYLTFTRLVYSSNGNVVTHSLQCESFYIEKKDKKKKWQT